MKKEESLWWSTEALIGVLVLTSFIGVIWYFVHDDGGGGLKQLIDKKVTERKDSGLDGEGKDYGTAYSADARANFEALVVVRDQHFDNPEADQMSALKRGDVLSIRVMPHLWSDTERASYLIVPLSITGREADALLTPKKEGETVVTARAKKIDLDKAGFAEGADASAQPLEHDNFTTDVIVEK